MPKNKLRDLPAWMSQAGHTSTKASTEPSKKLANDAIEKAPSQIQSSSSTPLKTSNTKITSFFSPTKTGQVEMTTQKTGANSFNSSAAHDMEKEPFYVLSPAELTEIAEEMLKSEGS